MSILLIIVLVILAVVAAVLLYANTRPATFRVERSIRIDAPPEAIFPHLEDFHKWTAWSPWENLDPALTRSYHGPSAGVGTVYSWDGNKKVGTGRMEIVESLPPRQLMIQLDFLRPFKASNRVEITLVPSGSSTMLHWAMFGPALFISKVMGLFMNMDQMIGRDFERGLAQLKSVSEK